MLNSLYSGCALQWFADALPKRGRVPQRANSVVLNDRRAQVSSPVMTRTKESVNHQHNSFSWNAGQSKIWRSDQYNWALQHKTPFMCVLQWAVCTRPSMELPSIRSTISQLTDGNTDEPLKLVTYWTGLSKTQAEESLEYEIWIPVNVVNRLNKKSTYIHSSDNWTIQRHTGHSLCLHS